MAIGAPFPDEAPWQRVVCRLCHHPFAVLVTDASAEAVDLCQVCAIFVERFGQREAAPPDAIVPQRAPRARELRRASPAGEKRDQADLTSLWSRWQMGWQHEQRLSSQERQPRKIRRKTPP